MNYVIVFGVGSFLDFLETRMIKPFLSGLFDIMVHSFSLKNSKKQKHLYVPWNCVLLLYICSNLWKIKKKCFCLISLCTYYFSETAWCCELVTNFVLFSDPWIVSTETRTNEMIETLQQQNISKTCWQKIRQNQLFASDRFVYFLWCPVLLMFLSFFF